MHKFHKIVFIFAFIIYMITAYNSEGYYHADEHYQIIEFSGLKLVTHTPDELAWEYKAAIRPALQPTICYVVFSTLQFFGIDNPYSQTFALRLMTMFLALFVIQFFVKTMLHKVSEKHQKLFILFSYFLWFLPFINIRFSSETWSGLLFLLAFSVFEFSKNKQKQSYFLIGFLLGLSFLFRYQTAFLSFGFIACLVFIYKENFKNISKIFTSILLVFTIGILIDYWFYGKLEITSWNYFYVNLIEGAASGFGESPWYYYFLETIKQASIPIGIIILISVIIFGIKYPKNLIFWCFLPFILIHILIAHKEFRFLFPIVNFIPFILILTYQDMEKYFQKFKLHIIYKSFSTVLFGILIILNFIGLTAMASKSAGDGKTKIEKYIYEKYPEKEIKMFHYAWANPYNPFESVPTKFYQNKNVTTVKIESLCELENSQLSKDTINILICRKVNLENEICIDKLDELHFKLVNQSVPNWLLIINAFIYKADEKDVLYLYEKE